MSSIATQATRAGAVPVAPGAILYTLGVINPFLFPILAALINSHIPLNDGNMSVLAGIDAIGMVISSLTGPFWIARVHWRYTAIASVCVLAMGSAAVLGASSVRELIVLKVFISVFGSGPTFALGVAALSQTVNPDRAFGVGGTAQAILPAILMFAPSLAYFHQLTHFSWLVTAFLICNLPVLLLLPVKSPVRSQPSARLTGTITLPRAALLLSAFAIVASYECFWSFSERVGRLTQLSPEAVAQLLSLSFLVSFTAGIVATWTAGRIRRSSVYLFATVTLAIGLTLLGLWPTPYAFVIAIFAVNFCSVLATALNFGAMVEEDASGRLAVLGPTCQFAGLLLGPLLSGAVVDGGHYTRSALAAGALSVIAAIAFVLFERTTRRNSNAQTVASSLPGNY